MSKKEDNKKVEKKEQKVVEEDKEVEKKDDKKKGGKKAKVEKTNEIVYYGPKNVKDTDRVFAVCHIYASFNNTIIVIFYLKKACY
jgi:hypothetical protein